MSLKQLNVELFRDYLNVVSGTNFAILQLMAENRELGFTTQDIKHAIKQARDFYVSSKNRANSYLKQLIDYHLVKQNEDNSFQITDYGKILYSYAKEFAKYLPTKHSAKMKGPLILLYMNENKVASYKSIVEYAKLVGIRYKQVNGVMKNLRRQRLVEALRPSEYKRVVVETKNDLTPKQKEVFDRIPNNWHTLTELAERFKMDRTRTRRYLEKLCEKGYVKKKAKEYSYRLTIEGENVAFYLSKFVFLLSHKDDLKFRL